MLGTPFIPEKITVHLGTPDSSADNVTVDFPEYIKNVASSEIYPTWPESALRANIYAIITYALNRIYTESYPSKEYDFDITNTTQYDQAFVLNRSVFENISVIVDELFNDYVVRNGFTEPYFTSFCNGTTVTCEGLSQWGTVGLAEQGYIPYEILQYYYGDDIQMIKDAPVMTNIMSYPGSPLSEGDSSESIKILQIELNRISKNYPKIPKIPEINGVYGPETTAAVREFQQIFNLPANGVTDKSTWYKVAYIFTNVKRLAELDSEGITLSKIPKQYSEQLSFGMQNDSIKVIQYYLAVIGAYYERVIPVPVTGYFGEQTEHSVKSFQTLFSLPVTGIINEATWNEIYRAYAGIVESVPINLTDIVALYPETILKEGVTNEYVKILQEYLTYMSKTHPVIQPVNNTGYFGPITKASVTAFQKLRGLTPNGVVDAATWNEIASVYSDLRFGSQKQAYQFPGYTIK